MEQSRAPEALFSDRVKINGVVTLMTLTVNGQLRWSDRCLVVEKEILGFVVNGSKIKIRTIVEAGAGICCGGNKGALVRKNFTFEPLSDDLLRLWCDNLQNYIDSLGRPKRLFVLVNPYGGKRSASKIFLDFVKPLLEDANIEITVQETQYRLHAKEIALSLELPKYDGIVCVSGDGILVEVINGLLGRGDWKTAITMPLGVVPAGTGNGMAKSLLDSAGEPCTPANAVLSIIRGHRHSLDVATVSQGQTKFFSVLMLAWGLVGDIDIESEKYRWMGSARIDFYAIQRIFCLRKYNGCIKFVPAPGYEACGEVTSIECESTGEVIPSEDGTDKLLVNGQQNGYQGADIDMKNLNWRKVDGPFVSIWLHNVPWGGEDTMAAPDAKFSDGYLDLIMVKDCTRLGLLRLMTELNNGGHVKSPHVQYLKVKAFILEPGPRNDDPSKEGIIDVDGELLASGKGTYRCDQKTLLAYEKLHINVEQGLATLFCPI
ncbi:unnamed protein product [Coffea canephora]|uniref:sphingosine kinase n=1 Tax=Coffea canephora TaxID=49390 RepID=A0A068TTK7_COFCA|nr:unnamed protein product [Coffea canephora]